MKFSSSKNFCRGTFLTYAKKIRNARKLLFLNEIALFSVLKNTFGAEYEGDIVLQLKEIQEPNFEKLVINMYSNDGRSVRINRKNISLDIRQAAQKF